ncbi:MAG: succinyl-diaminopimelate desuccinylase [Myxococcales bacterium]|nr:succinyl-diaminopimelate desuccinylase [Myxococcales bacterium]
MSSEDDARIGDTLAWLCSISSFTGEEGPIADAISARLAKARLAAPVRRYGNSLVVPVSRGTGGPRIALAGHTDVVRTEHDGPVRIEGDQLFGPGASDMKSGLALMLELLENDRDLCDKLDLTLVFYAREEGPYLDNELGPVLAQDDELRAVELAVCLEPSDNRLSLGASGSIHAVVSFSGRTSHSARPWQGDNAIHKAGPLLVELAQLAPRASTIDGLTYRTVTSVTLAEGGRGRNVIPDSFVLNVNHRFAPGTSLASAQAEVAALVGGRAAIAWLDLSPSALPCATHPYVVALAESGVRGVEPKQAWTDVARFSELGIAAVNWGPGVNAQAHQKNEWTSLTALRDGRDILSRWLRRVGAATSTNA